MVIRFRKNTICFVIIGLCRYKTWKSVSTAHRYDTPRVHVKLFEIYIENWSTFRSCNVVFFFFYKFYPVCNVFVKFVEAIVYRRTCDWIILAHVPYGKSHRSIPRKRSFNDVNFFMISSESLEIIMRLRVHDIAFCPCVFTSSLWRLVAGPRKIFSVESGLAATRTRWRYCFVGMTNNFVFLLRFKGFSPARAVSSKFVRDGGAFSESHLTIGLYRLYRLPRSQSEKYYYTR